MVKLTKNNKLIKLLDIQKTLYYCIEEAKGARKNETGDPYMSLFEIESMLGRITNEIDVLYLNEINHDDDRETIDEIKKQLNSLRDDAPLDYNEEISDILDLVNELEV